jgi:hypothetical protein
VLDFRKAAAHLRATLRIAKQFGGMQMQRLIFLVAATVALPGTTPAQGNPAYYGNPYTTLPRALSSDPVMPDSTSGPISITAPGSNVNMSRQARRDLDARVQSERTERDKRVEAWREPPLKFNIPMSEMPKPSMAN